MKFTDYYNVLGVDRASGADEIKRAYRKLARKYHPDVSKEPDAEQRFKEVGEAYETLKSPEKREAYDQLGAGYAHGDDFQPPPGWGGAGYGPGPTPDAAARQAQAEAFSDFFESMFGGRRAAADGYRGGQSGPSFSVPGEDVTARVQITLGDAYAGAERQISFEVSEPDERGFVQRRVKTLKVRIPKGVTQGQRIRLAGQGAPGMGADARPGDLYLQIEFAPDARFQAEGRDIHTRLPLAPWEAVLGTNITVDTLGGTVDMKIPPSSNTGNRLRLKGRGLPGNPPGDQFVTLEVVAPPNDNAETEKLYQSLSRVEGFNPRDKGASK